MNSLFQLDRSTHFWRLSPIPTMPPWGAARASERECGQLFLCPRPRGSCFTAEATVPNSCLATASLASLLLSTLTWETSCHRTLAHARPLLFYGASISPPPFLVYVQTQLPCKAAFPKIGFEPPSLWYSCSPLRLYALSLFPSLSFFSSSSLPPSLLSLTAFFSLSLPFFSLSVPIPFFLIQALSV